jgi:RHS repeat-associated protein
MASGNRDVRYWYGKNGELLGVTDNGQRLGVAYKYDVMGREVARVYGNGVRQETAYDRAGRVILIREIDSGNRVIRAEGYLYDGEGRRSHSVDEEGRVTKYIYDGQSRLGMVVYPWTEEKSGADRIEVEEAGLFFTVDRGRGERYALEAEEVARLREVMNLAGPGLGNAVGSAQMVWREIYGYDGNGNRVSKTTPWGTIVYSYDRENRITRKGDIVYRYDKDGNLTGEEGLRRSAEYGYDGRGRMVYSRVRSAGGVRAAWYGYDGLGRRTVVRDEGGPAIRTLYDGMSFEAVREGETFTDGSFTTKFSVGVQRSGEAGTEGSRYRWVGEGGAGVRTRSAGKEEYSGVTGRYGSPRVTLYGKGEAVAVSRGGSERGRGGPAYLGKDVLGSVRSVTDENGAAGRYEYDVFGKPYAGDFEAGMDLGYTGKPYDAATEMYNYGYRDYAPEVARFTTEDPIRDGANWFAYVNNDPVNWIDPWGLTASDNGGVRIVNNKKITVFVDEQSYDIVTYNESFPPKTILKYINQFSYYQYAMDRNGYLYQTKKNNKEGGSIIYSEIINQSISSSNTRTINIGVSNTATVLARIPIIGGYVGMIEDVNSGYGGAVTYGLTDSKFPVSIVVSTQQNPYMNIDGVTMYATPAQKIMHELVVHANPIAVHNNDNNSINLENAIRTELGLPNRVPGETHTW